MAGTASPSLTDFLTPVASESQSSPPESFLTARTQPQHAASRPDQASQRDRWARVPYVCKDCYNASASRDPSMCSQPGHDRVMLLLPAG